MQGLTKRQKEIAEYVQEFIQTNGYSPSFREIMLHFNFSSPGTVYRHIHTLKRKGVFQAEKYSKRSLTLDPSLNVQHTHKEIELPLMGTISAGSPIETFIDASVISVPHSLVHLPEQTYVLKAVGDSLREEMIIDGDLLLVEARQEALAGETIVALINNHDTIVKRYYPEGHFIRLTGHQTHHHPMLLRGEDINIQGVLVGLIRTY